jgi:NAD(P)-dependent dehydrogenase (short-subunit alcohol dehydrogenase family)
MPALDGRVALVTGASRGIGQAIALRLASAGAAVAVTARTVEEGDHPLAGSLITTTKAITNGGGTAIGVAADLTSRDERARIVDTVERELGPVDILVNNAAVTFFEPAMGFSDRHYDVMFDVQVRAPFALAQRVVPPMRERGRGWILNISSAAAHHPQGPPYTDVLAGTVYGMCKAALERFTTGLAAELYGVGIAVNSLAPTGLVMTPGALLHRLDARVAPEFREPAEHTAEAAFALCTGDPAVLTGKVTDTRTILEELGISPPPPA